MSDCIIIIPGRGKTRRVPPPLPADGGGFYYLKRKSDGAILLDGDGYASFESEDAARAHADTFPDQISIEWMPKMKVN